MKYPYVFQSFPIIVRCTGFGRDVSVDPEESEPGICFLAFEMTNW